jgi:catechol 2,3-dioxygenase-like lactoylglutathione lyase family enzyme
MSEHPFGSHIVAQVGIIVQDIERTGERYCQIFGVPKPPVIITDTPDKARTSYRGGPTDARAKLMFFDMGQVQIELIEPIGGPSIWQEHLDKYGESVHHIAFWVKDSQGVLHFLAEHGVTEAQHGYFEGGMYRYVDSAPQLGVMLELLERFER